LLLLGGKLEQIIGNAAYQFGTKSTRSPSFRQEAEGSREVQGEEAMFLLLASQLGSTSTLLLHAIANHPCIGFFEEALHWRVRYNFLIAMINVSRDRSRNISQLQKSSIDLHGVGSDSMQGYRSPGRQDDPTPYLLSQRAIFCQNHNVVVQQEAAGCGGRCVVAFQIYEYHLKNISSTLWTTAKDPQFNDTASITPEGAKELFNSTEQFGNYKKLFQEDFMRVAVLERNRQGEMLLI